ncbi:MAG: prepilin-type N-terminal cleavage/methylation domain-containing protein [Candidatus Methylacidiphilales bacterium]|nr:prepilin-type N-terminal cleavage/methylation domain-containing protein [Candidatus Methylacidiphilales bacterium]
MQNAVKRRIGQCRSEASAFTLVEMMVAVTVLVLLLTMLLGVISQTSKVTRWASEKVSAFQGARAAFDLMVRNVSQATLNAYWDYDQLPSPTRYLRKSELHFLVGQAGVAPFPGTVNSGHVLFFQAPSGVTHDLTNYGGLETLLNAIGYYVEYRARETLPPPFPAQTPVYRYFLMQAVQPSEELKVYDHATGDTWIQDVADTAAPIAENVICLIVWPRRSPEDDPAGLALTTNYAYDSRLNVSSNPQPQTANQLPPTVQLTIVALDETSAARLCLNATPPGEISNTLTNLFLDPAKYAADLTTLESSLSANNIKFRTFNMTVPIRESKME